MMEDNTKEVSTSFTTTTSYFSTGGATTANAYGVTYKYNPYEMCISTQPNFPTECYWRLQPFSAAANKAWQFIPWVLSETAKNVTATVNPGVGELAIKTTTGTNHSFSLSTYLIWGIKFKNHTYVG